MYLAASGAGGTTIYWTTAWEPTLLLRGDPSSCVCVLGGRRVPASVWSPSSWAGGPSSCGGGPSSCDGVPAPVWGSQLLWWGPSSCVGVPAPVWGPSSCVGVPAPVMGSQLLCGVLVPGLGVPAPQRLRQAGLRSAGSRTLPPDSAPFLLLEVRAASACPPFALLPNLSLMTIASIYHQVTTPDKILVHLIPAVSEMNLEDISLSERSQTEKATHAWLCFMNCFQGNPKRQRADYRLPGEEAEWETGNMFPVSFLGDKNFLKLDSAELWTSRCSSWF